MLRFTAAVLATLVAVPLFAQTPPPAPPPGANGAPSLPRDEKTRMIGGDLHALERIATLAKDPEDSRQVILAIIDSDVDVLREPRPDGTYRWASLQREEASRVKDQKSIEKVQTEKELREVTITATNAYRLEVSVPTKRNLISANNRVYVRNVLVDSTGFDGKTTHHEIAVNAWVNPGDANGVALPEIGKSVKATAEIGVESGNKTAVAEVALLQAKLVDDPASPYFPAIKRLLQIRDFAAEKNINRGHLKNAIDEAELALPGELEKRVAEQNAATDERRQLAASGQTTGAIALGDATPDVVTALQDISRLLGGTLQDQTDARTKLQALIDTLPPKPAAPPHS